MLIVPIMCCSNIFSGYYNNHSLQPVHYFIMFLSLKTYKSSQLHISPLKPCSFSNFPPLSKQGYSWLSLKSNFYNWSLGGIITLNLHIWQYKSLSISCCCMSYSPFHEAIKKWLGCLPTLLLLGSSFRVLYLWWLEIRIYLLTKFIYDKFNSYSLFSGINAPPQCIYRNNSYFFSAFTLLG